MADNKVRVEVETAFKDAGVKNASQAFKDLEKNVAAAGKGSKDATSALEAMGKEGSAAKNVFEGLNQTMNGGTGAVFGLAKAWHALKAALVTNPLAAIGAVILGLTPLLIGFGRRLLRIGDEAKTGAGKAADAFAEAKSAGERLNDVKFEAFKQELDEVGRRAGAAAAVLERLYDLQTQGAKAQMELELATIEANPSLTPEQKKGRTAEVRSRYAEAGFQRDEQKSSDALAIKERSAAELRALADQAATNLSSQRSRVSSLRSAPEDRSRVQEELRRQLGEVVAERTRLTVMGGADNIQRADFLAVDQRKLQEGIEYLNTRSEVAQSPGAQAAARTQMDALAKAEAAAKDAETRARKAEAELTEARRLSGIEREYRPIIRGMQRQTESIELGAQRRESLGSIGRGISKTLEGAAGGAFSGAVERARAIADRLGDGTKDEEEAQALNELLTRIGNYLDRSTVNQLTPLVQTLRELTRRIERNEQETANVGNQLKNLRK